MCDFAGRRVAVTGAGGGIGRATALAFAQEGADVLSLDLDEAAAEKTAVACAELGVQGEGQRCDVTDAAALTALAARDHAARGPVDVVVANAGVGLTGRFLDMTIDDWRWIRSVNLDGVVHTAHAFGRPMVGRGSGHLVVVASGLGYVPRATEPAYVATKAAVLALARSLRADWRRAGVGVSAICPGVINTPIARSTRFVGAQATAKRRRRVERLFSRGHPPELVARAVVEAVREDQAVVPVGWEARMGWWFHRAAPLWAQEVLARREVR